MSDTIVLGRDDYPGLSQKEKEKIWKYQADMADKGEKFCSYARIGKRGLKTCKIHGNRCWYNEDYLYCPKFQTWFLDDEGAKAEKELLEEMSPVG